MTHTQFLQELFWVQLSQLEYTILHSTHQSTHIIYSFSKTLPIIQTMKINQTIS